MNRQQTNHGESDNSKLLAWVLACHHQLLSLYPSTHHLLFAEEMHEVFADGLMQADTEGWCAILALCWREFRDLPQSLLVEYQCELNKWVTLHLQESEKRSSNLPGVVPIDHGSLPHVVYAVVGYNPRIRRGFDLIAALFGLTIAAPFLLLLPIFIWLDSSGPVIYRQKRIGKDGRAYTMYKFRSMPRQTLPLVAVEHPMNTTPDPRLTRMGRFTRRFHLDELPQLINVFKGEMSIFGPRPPMAD